MEAEKTYFTHHISRAGKNLQIIVPKKERGLFRYGAKVRVELITEPAINANQNASNGGKKASQGKTSRNRPSA